jgi:Bleomycin resistance protein-like N-terminal
MAFREVLVTQVREVLQAWLAGAGKRPAARRAGVDVKTAARYIRAAQAAGLARDGDESQLSDELLGQVVVAVRPARPAGHGESWEALAGRQDAITGWVKDSLTLVKMHEFLERSGTMVPYRTLARFAAAECGYSSSSRHQVTVPVDEGKPGEEVQLDFGSGGSQEIARKPTRASTRDFTAAADQSNRHTADGASRPSQVDVSGMDASNNSTMEMPEVGAIDMKLEVVTLPVSDVDRAKRFYQSLGWRMDADIVVGDAFRVVQLMPPARPARSPSGRASPQVSRARFSA